MKTRIIIGIILALFAISLLVLTGLGYSDFISIPIGLFSAIAAHEIMGVSKCKNKVLTWVSVAFAGLYAPYIAFDFDKLIPVPSGVIIIAYVILCLVIMLKWYDKTKFENVALALFGSIAIPGALSTYFKLVDLVEANPHLFQRSQLVYMILMSMYAAWLGDTFAYFFGRKLGKHKLAPKISPKKSVEGAIAGVTGSTVFAVITYYICDVSWFYLDTIKVWMVVAALIFMYVLGACGDLSASVIKRNFNEKDFGSIFPGHGGVLDRIDSFLFTLPALYAIVAVGVAIAG